jgi:large subunit ribosomal protein L9
MKVVFLEDVAGTADAGEVKEVKNGFARNFLLPKGLAAPATQDQLQRVTAIEKVAQENRLKFSNEWTVVAEAMEGTMVEVSVRVGPSGRLFGAVTGRNIAEKLTEVTGREIDHRQVLLGTAIHEPGEYPVAVRLYRDVHANVIVSVIPEGLTAEEAAALAAADQQERAAFETEQATAQAEAPEGEGSSEESATEEATEASETPAEAAPEETNKEKD